jgi:hypothetical protein
MEGEVTVNDCCCCCCWIVAERMLLPSTLYGGGRDWNDASDSSDGDVSTVHALLGK